MYTKADEIKAPSTARNITKTFIVHCVFNTPPCTNKRCSSLLSQCILLFTERRLQNSCVYVQIFRRPSHFSLTMNESWLLYLSLSSVVNKNRIGLLVVNPFSVGCVGSSGHFAWVICKIRFRFLCFFIFPCRGLFCTPRIQGKGVGSRYLFALV